MGILELAVTSSYDFICDHVTFSKIAKEEVMEQIKIGTSGLTTSRIGLAALMMLSQSRQSAPLWNGG